MNVLRWQDPAFAGKIERLVRGSTLFDRVIEQRVRDIVEAVAKGGDEALLELTARFDGARLTPERLAVTRAEILGAAAGAEESFTNALEFAVRNIAAFSRRSLRRGWAGKNAQGARVGEKYDPFERVGIYVPGGTAPLVSTALMTVTLARVAGCHEIVVCSPCNKAGDIHPGLLLAAWRAGATEIYRAGGAQAIAALALGTPSIRPVQKIFGPGNAYVVAAKRLLFGHVAVDLLPGPSELFVLADDTANPRYVAADILAQAEHGSGLERVWLATPSARMLRAVEKEVARQLKGLERREYIKRVLEEQGWLIQVESIAGGVVLANRLAPEHCEIHTRSPRRVADGVRTAGAIFLGPWSPTVLGDYVAGPSHTLPTGGAGRSFAGLTVDQFQRRTSVVEYSRSALRKSLGAVRMFAAVEGLGAHGRSAEVRFKG